MLTIRLQLSCLNYSRITKGVRPVCRGLGHETYKRSKQAACQLTSVGGRSFSRSRLPTLLLFPMATRNARAKQHTYPQDDEFGNFTNLLDKLLAVPHSKIKAELDAEKRKRTRKKRAAVGHAFRDAD